MHDQFDQLEPEAMLREITELEGRIGELRQAAGLPQPDLRATLDAALVELELALAALRAMGSEQGAEQGGSAAAENERRVLRTVFQDAPVPLFLLDRTSSVRRVNRQAALLLGVSAGYVSGKQFASFCDLATRAAVRSQLAAVVRTGRRRRVQVRFLGRERGVDAVVTLARVWIRGEPDPMVVVAAGAAGPPQGGEAAPRPQPAERGAADGQVSGKPPAGKRPAKGRGPRPDAPNNAVAAPAVPRAEVPRQSQLAQPGARRADAERPGSDVPATGRDEAEPGKPPRAPQTAGVPAGDDETVATMVHRMDVLATACELLLDEPVFNETVAVRRCARLLAAELGDWALVDLVGPGGPVLGGSGGATAADAVPLLRRQVAMGPDDERSVEAARMLEELEPVQGTLPHTVFVTRQSTVRPHVDDLELLGVCPDGQPVCAKIGATSVLCVPIEDGERCLGTITLAASGEYGPFDLVDLGVVQRLGRYLALVIRASRLYRRRAEVADTLQAGLLPKSLPAIPGASVAARYLTATHGSAEVGGDFYDVFRTEDGWGLILGDVCGKGEDAAAVTATARHCARLAARWKSTPGDVLGVVNEALLDEDRFVTAVMAGLTMETERVLVSLGVAGHPPAVVVKADGVIRSASRGGVPLGLFEDFEAGLDAVELSVGDTLVLHSDGVLEACDLQRQEFGQERLLETLAAHAKDSPEGMLAAVEHALVEFCDGDLRDDVSMLALRVEAPTLD
ncbi:SpoIIE family protein phosphatase [Actinomadura algeriensis]|uniref:PAS domain S-box-containing protein n=1 Tax=Actinomadura algeriensis TaxID=1679523 RepID=A0ABR9JTE4_9ACTN|nr:SpoIIE family protein phosphatase [Actinomadura algeriensis]MBE1533845.1 PAS domain S-box-containing protein [Actinomadura algeriensis]